MPKLMFLMPLYPKFTFLLAILLSGSTLCADSIIMQDGSTRTGTIISEQTGFITFNSPTFGQIQIPRSQIKSITKDATAKNPNANVSTLIAAADAEKARGNLGEAINQYVQAAKISITPELVTAFHSTFKQLSEAGSARLATTPDQARESFKALYTALTDPVTQKLFQQGAGEQTFQQAASNVTSKYAEANVMLANRMVNNSAMRTQMQGLYRDAVALTQNSNPAYLLGYGDAARSNGDLETAFNAYKTVLSAAPATKEQKDTAYERISRVESASGGRFKLPATAPVPVAPTPYAAVAPLQTSPLPTAPTQAVPVSTPAGPALPIWKQTLNSITDGSILQKAKNLATRYITEDILLLLGVLVGLYIFLWVLPYQVLKYFARRGDSEAGDRLYNAKKLGIFSLIPFLVKKASQPRASRHRCPFCNKGIDSMEDYKDLNFIVCPHCREPITPIYDMKDYVDHLITQLKISHKAGAKGKRGDLLIEKDAMLKLVRGVLALTIRRRASDLHMETANEGGKVRARIDGIMYELITLPREISPAFISALKVMANLDITERRVPQDGKIALWLDQQDYDLRINTSPASMGEKVVIRILRQDAINITPSRLGLDGPNLVIYERNIHKPHGVIIVTGPSGSGKSTTLYVALNELNSGDKNIVTIEDPIEYQLKGLSQMQVNPGANFTFATGLRSILRQDPDVIMVGEIRDKETAEAALDAAMTGHMVLTTLHTIDAPSAFSRMRDLGIEQARVANAVNLIIAQRLVRTICSDCRKAYKPKQTDIEKLGIEKMEDIQYVHGTGCETCMNTGYYGRLAIFEMLELTDAIKAQLEANAATSTVRESARANGMRSLREEGIRKVTEGVTTVEEVIRVTT